MQFRCTRQAPYTGNCPGRLDVSERQGYYFECDNATRALLEMAVHFPDDVLAGFGFDVQYWDYSEDHAKIANPIDKTMDYAILRN